MTPAAPPAGLAVRPATEADLERMVELLAHGSLVEGKEDATDLGPYRAAWGEIARGPGDLLVAELAGQVVGVCQLIVFRHFQDHGGLCGQIESVHVHPDRRGSGIGRVLMAAAIERAAALGCYRVQLTSNVTRLDAHRFYESLGFAASHVGFKRTLSP
jgi:GNAT superfamily N-acetyltransferase